MAPATHGSLQEAYGVLAMGRRRPAARADVTEEVGCAGVFAFGRAIEAVADK